MRAVVSSHPPLSTFLKAVGALSLIPLAMPAIAIAECDNCGQIQVAEQYDLVHVKRTADIPMNWVESVNITEVIVFVFEKRARARLLCWILYLLDRTNGAQLHWPQIILFWHIIYVLQCSKMCWNVYVELDWRQRWRWRQVEPYIYACRGGKWSGQTTGWSAINQHAIRGKSVCSFSYFRPKGTKSGQTFIDI